MSSPLAQKPARYYPLAHGKYEVSAGLKALGTPMGNGEADKKVFQIDECFPHYRAVKLAARDERLTKYYPENSDLSDAAASKVARFMVQKLTEEYPEIFTLAHEHGAYGWDCAHTKERFFFTEDFRLLRAETSVKTPYRDAFDAIATQIQEDFSIWRREPETKREWLGSIHLCYPNHWAAEDKIGRPFNVVHVPVAGFDRLAKAKDGLIDMIVTKGPFVRFAWGVATDTELNHHPKNEFQGRAFDPRNPELHLRIERQTLSPFSEEGASLFTIRTYFLNCVTDVSTDERRALIQAIEGMTPESLVYKGLHRTKPAVIDWLKSLS